MQNNISVFLVIIMALIGFISCSHPTGSYERSNNNDPVNENYYPGSASDLKLDINPEGIIKIAWEDTVQFEDGFIVEKSLGDSTSFLQIGTLGPDSTTFYDSSRIVRKNTFFRVSTIKRRGNDIEKWESSISKLQRLGSIETFDLVLNESNKLDIAWQASSPFDVVYRLESKEITDSEFEIMGEFKPPVSHAIDELSDISFIDREYKLSQIVRGVNYEDIISVSESELNSAIFDPSNVSVKYEDEQTINISWEDNSFFEGGYKIIFESWQHNPPFGHFSLLFDEVEIADLPSNANTYQHTFDLINRNKYIFKVIAYTSDTESGIAEEEENYNIPTPIFINDRYSNTAGNSIDLSWSIKSDELVNEYVLQRKQASGPWVEIGRFDPSVTNYTDSNVDPALSHQYRIKSLSSDSTDLILYYRTLYNKVGKFELEDLGRRISISPDGNYVASTYRQLDVWNVSTGEKILFDNAFTTDAQFNREGDILGVSYSGTSGMIRLLEFPSGTLIKEIPFANPESIVFGPDSDFLYVANSSARITKMDIATGDILFHYQGDGTQYNGQYNLGLSPDGALITINEEKPRMINTDDGTLAKSLARRMWDRYSNHPQFSADGSKLALHFDKVLNVYSTDTWEPVYESRGRYLPHFDPLDSDVLIWANYDYVRFTRLSSKSSVNMISSGVDILDKDFTSDGNRIALIGYSSAEIWEKADIKGWKRIF